jgi:5-enolpyruvylshikimate-3-phosphate synthase
MIGLACGNTVINGAECVAKTYPDFWYVLKNLGGKVSFHE